MLKRIFTWVGFLIIVALILAWIASGGAGRMLARAKAVENPFARVWDENPDTDFGGLPWAIEMPRGAYIDPETGAVSGSWNTSGPEEGAASDVRSFGNPSPESGHISIRAGSAASDIASGEYVTLTSPKSGSPTDISAWSLQSVVSGVRVYIPLGTNVFLLGQTQKKEPILLYPGEEAIIVSGASPVGISFRENRCTGYLEQFQMFTPPLTRTCPAPASELPATSENTSAYGDACVRFVATIPSCTFYMGTIPSQTATCSRFVGNTLSHNGCVGRHRNDTDFFSGSWRIYLGSPSELWENDHDTIRLLDDQGRVVDVMSY